MPSEKGEEEEMAPLSGNSGESSDGLDMRARLERLEREVEERCTKKQKSAHTFESVTTLHLRVLFERGDVYVATVVRDKRSQTGELRVHLGVHGGFQSSLQPCVLIRKGTAAGKLVLQNALSYADVVRVEARLDTGVAVHKKRTVSGLYKTEGSNRSPRKRPDVHVTFDSLELVASYDSDVEAVRSLARTVQSDNVAQLLSPNDGDPPEQALLKLGVAQI